MQNSAPFDPARVFSYRRGAVKRHRSAQVTPEAVAVFRQGIKMAQSNNMERGSQPANLSHHRATLDCRNLHIDRIDENRQRSKEPYSGPAMIKPSELAVRDPSLARKA